MKLLPSATKLWRLCFYTCLSHSVHGGRRGSTWARYTPQGPGAPPLAGQVHTLPEHPPGQGRYTLPRDQVLPLGRAGTPPLGRYTPPRTGTPPGRYTPPPSRRLLLRTVRIVLECILIVLIFRWFLIFIWEWTILFLNPTFTDMEYLEALTEGLNRVLMVRGSGKEVVTIYS